MSAVHASALVDPSARIAPDARVGAYSVIGPDVTLGAGVEVGHHCVLEGRVELGPRVRVGHGSILGAPPQDLKFKPDTPSGVRVGAGTELREYVTVHRATAPGGFTEIGEACLLMTMCHVGHDCRVGDGAILINAVGLSGHVEVGEHATLGGLAGVHQFCRIGAFAYVGGLTKVTQDVPPYMLVDGNPGAVHGVNVIGLRRHGMPAAERRALQDAYRLLYRAGLSPRRAVERIRRELAAVGPVARLLAFVEASRRGICRPPGRGGGAPAGEKRAAAQGEPV